MNYFADERIAVDYLLAQSGRGDLRPSLEVLSADSETGLVLPEIQSEEVTETELLDATVCLAEDVDIDVPRRSMLKYLFNEEFFNIFCLLFSVNCKFIEKKLLSRI